MLIRRLTTLAATLSLVFVASTATTAGAQGITSGAVSGFITDTEGNGIVGAQVTITNRTTGYVVRTTTREGGRYAAQGLESGGPYSISARRIGFEPANRDNIMIQLGQTSRQDLAMTAQTANLGTVEVRASSDDIISPSKTGTGTTITEENLRRLPSLNRNFADFVKTVPQVTTTTSFLSGGGVNLRQNSIQIDGAQSGDPFGLGGSGQPGASAGAKSIPLDAVKEYQALLSPFSVRHGNFGGLLINAVTKTGTNEFHGSLYGYTRDQKLTRSQPYLGDFTQQNYGLTVGGPVIKDRIFFFASGELQRRKEPAQGSYIGAEDEFVAQSTIDQFSNILSTKYGFADAGTGAQVPRENPNRNFFGRIDANLPLNTRLVLRHNYASADQVVFGGRSFATAANPNFPLTSNKYDLSNTTHSSVVQFLTNLTSGVYNELLFNRGTIKDFRTVPVRFPQITISAVPRSDATGTARLVAGTEVSSQGNSLDQTIYEITDNLTIPLGAHSITIGTKNQFYKSVNLFAQNSIGHWTFANLAALEAGTASSYVFSAPAPTDPNNGISTVKANQYALYLEDAWTVNSKLTLTGGIRWDKPDFKTLPPENESVFTQYGRHTSSVPSKAQWSPRFGFNFDINGDAKSQLRGGIGSFSGAVPFVYLSNAFGASGLSGYSQLTCNNNAPTNTSTTSLRTPAFTTAAIENPPTACADAARPNGTIAPGSALTGPAAGANVATIDPDFKFPKYLKGTLAFDRRFSNGLLATIEGLYTYSQNNAFYQNLALAGVQGTNEIGRVLYGTLTATGATATTTGSRQQVLDVTNSSGDYIWSLTSTLRKGFLQDRLEATASYTYQQARDVVSLTSSTQGSNFRYQRSMSGRLDDMSVTKSKYDQPHRIGITAFYRMPSLTDISVFYSGSSGAPYDYVYLSNGGTTGDLNADGQTQNDLVYVPQDATDPTEILFTGYNGTAAQQTTAAAQAVAFDEFISSIDCLNEARGTILKRNACRNPWINHIDVSLAQSLAPFGGGQNFQLRLDVLNFANLLNKKWGNQAFSDQNATCGPICSATGLVTHTGNRVAAGQPTLPVVTFDQTFKAFDDQNAGSNYRMQLSLRYSF